MRRPSFFIVLTVLALTGCNTMFQNTYQKISVHTPGVENVDCVLESDKINYHMLAPGVVEVNRARAPLTITCQKTGYLDAVETLKSRIYANPGQLNVFNGLVPGIAYDFASGSVFDYPDVVVIKMRRDPDRIKLPPQEQGYVLQKKPVPVRHKALTPADKAETENLFSKSSRK